MIFKKIRYKNLLSSGNVFTEIILNANQNALIVGENGAGKSTVLDALCFVLFGKAFRSINKPSLINSVNGKDCRVEIEFDINNKEYKVVRGIKPNIFEIYCNGKLVNQDSAMRDYQEYLEKFILRMSYKSFTQIVILGSASFTPFMQLKPADRRNVIEDLLDIQVFSVMNIIAKTRAQVNRENLEKNRLLVNGKEEKIRFIEKTIQSLKQNNDEKRSTLQAVYDEHKKNVSELNEKIEKLITERDVLLSEALQISFFKEKHSRLISLQSKIDTNHKRHKKEIAFYHDNDSCPTCKQSINSEFKDRIVCETAEKIVELETGLVGIRDKIGECVVQIANLEKLLQEGNEKHNLITKYSTQLKTTEYTMETIREQIDTLTNSDKLLQDNEQDLRDTKTELEVLRSEQQELLEERKFIETAVTLLKDGGIKTKIIKQYLPIINKMINKYLAQMGFFVDFNINEQFEETIKSRYRDEFSYHNFSEGEKMRIDLSILLTWRHIAKMRNSVNTNLLILDEVMDGSLDNNGTDEFLKIMWNMLVDTNTFVISHKQDQMIDRFEKVYRFEKVKNFSRLAS